MASTTLEQKVVRTGGERRLYTWAAILVALVVFAGFAQTYYLNGISGAKSLSTLLHIHGIVMTAWVVLFFTQVRLVATGNTRVHRRLGAAGAILAVLVVVVSTATAITAARLGHTPGPPPLKFLAIPLGEVVTFVTLVSAALWLRRRPDYHKRLMLTATVAILTPAISRIFTHFLGFGVPPMFFATVDLILLGCIAFDTYRNRRLHPAFAAGLAVVVGSQVGRVLLLGTAQWDRIAAWLVS